MPSRAVQCSYTLSVLVNETKKRYEIVEIPRKMPLRPNCKAQPSLQIAKQLQLLLVGALSTVRSQAVRKSSACGA